MRIVISYLVSLSYLYHYNQVKLQFSGFPTSNRSAPPWPRQRHGSHGTATSVASITGVRPVLKLWRA